jgi:hypothetical protein
LEDNFMTVIESFAVELGSGVSGLGLFAPSDDDCEPAAQKRLRVSGGD